MCLLFYYKLGSKWYLQYPEYNGPAEDLERVGAFHDFLDIIAEEEESVHIRMETASFEAASEMVLTGKSGDRSGAYYHIDKIEGRKIDLEIWFNSFIYTITPELPERIYFRKVFQL